MTDSRISQLDCREIIDSRGNPTVEVDVVLEDRSFGRAAVPSGASTGALEAIEMRDGDTSRFNGKGVLAALENIRTVIKPRVAGMDATDQSAIDRMLIELDGTDNKARLGANAILGVSLAVARAAADHSGHSLYARLGGPSANLMPVPMFNIINGGAHANNSIDLQEFMVMPLGMQCFSDALRAGCEIFHALRRILDDSSLSTAVGDEGGFAPEIDSTTDALELVVKSIANAGYRPGEEVWIALDCASSEYFTDGRYEFTGEGVIRTREENVDYLARLVDEYPIVSIEDGCAEDDWEGWRQLTEQVGKRCQLVGDDLFVTNRRLLQKGIDTGCANAILVKVNQIGTMTETLDAMNLAQDNDYAQVMSHRSGETEDTIIADLAVATGCGQIKAGSLSRSDRLAKYNQLLRIEQELGSRARYPGRKAIGQLNQDDAGA